MIRNKINRTDSVDRFIYFIVDMKGKDIWVRFEYDEKYGHNIPTEWIYNEYSDIRPKVIDE